MRKYIVTKTSDSKFEDVLTMETLDDLLSFVDFHGAVIISLRDSGDVNLEIYDAYRE